MKTKNSGTVFIGQIERRVEIKYRWWRNGNIKLEHVEALEEAAMERIGKMMAEGYQSGDLFATIHVTDDDPEDGVEYSGWWEATIEQGPETVEGETP